MYVCMYRGRPSWRCPWDQAFQWAKWSDPSGSWVQYPNPAVPSIPRHARWFILAHEVCFLYQLYSRQLRVTCFLMFTVHMLHWISVSHIAWAPSFGGGANINKNYTTFVCALLTSSVFKFSTVVLLLPLQLAMLLSPPPLLLLLFSLVNLLPRQYCWKRRQCNMVAIARYIFDLSSFLEIYCPKFVNTTHSTLSSFWL